MTILNGEWRFHPRFSIGGRYGSSSFRETTAIDTDWFIGIPSVIWWQSNSTSKAKMDFFDMNIYYRLLDLDKSQMSEKFSSFLLLDRFSLDIFGGYQQQTGRYGDTNLVDVIQWWTPVNSPIAGLDSFYKIRYKGPRLGVRFKGWANDKFSSKLSFSYALIKTEAYGWWNLRDLTFWHNGDDGFAYNIDAEVTYHLTPNWFIGIGYHYMKYRQKELTETRILPGYSHYDLDVVRDANNKVYGPSFRVGYMW
ncbi:MAG: hypothetical protein NG737_07340 [Omnitrophica bacterium]|nr:hypothetical protein [Candidatus Omnitrophota bacterium]